jgi:hypothetical protein
MLDARGKLTRGRRLELPALTIGARTLRPVARLSGWGAGGVGNRASAWLQVVPVEIVVREHDGRECRVRLVDSTASVLRAITGVALLVALLGWVVRRAWT